MRATVEGAGVELAYEEVGRGEAVLFVHDMAGGARSWAPMARRLAPHARVVTYDRRGYGGSGAPEPYEGTTVYEQGEDAAELITRLGLDRPVVCGAGFGALIALDLAVRRPECVRALVCAEPPLHAFVPAATEVLAAQHELLRETTRERGPQAAVDSWRSEYPSVALGLSPPGTDRAGGTGADADAGTEAAAGHRGFFADFAGVSSWPVTRAQLRAIAVPMVVLTGPGTPPHLLAAAEALARLAPSARRADDGDVAAAVQSLLG